MINKKNVLGKTPEELGTKDAIHVAIVSVRAGGPIKPGQNCKPNKDREFVPGDGPGVADPFRKTNIGTGESFWLLINQEEIPNVRHEWDHPCFDFSPPVTEAKGNKYLAEIAEEFGVTYRQLIEAGWHVVNKHEPAPYPGSKSDVEVATANRGLDDYWYEWSNETSHEFPNYGSACCPETEYPTGDLFVAKGTQ